MSSSSPEPTLTERQHMTASYASFKHNASLAMLVLAPLLIALPPRKLDLYTFTLAGAMVVGANQLTRERTGTGIWGRLRDTLVREEVGDARRNEWIPADRRLTRVERPQGRLLDEKVPPAEGVEEKPSPIATASKSDWKAERLRMEQEKLDEGEGYGSMIVGQIWDVWNWGEKKIEEVEEEDRKVLREREREKRREAGFPRIGKD